MNAYRAVAGLATAIFSLSLVACSGGGGGGTVATVNGQKIQRSDLDSKLESGPQGKNTLNQLIQAALIDQYAKENNITASDAEVQKKIDEVKAKYPNGQFENIVAQQNLTPADLNNIFRQQVILEKAVAPKVKVTDADVKAYFDKNHAQLDKPEQLHARHILVADLKTANEVEAKLKGGAKFEDLAKQYSTDSASATKGGDLGTFGHNQMVKPFEDAAFKAPIGKPTAPVKSAFGYHIIEVLEKKPAVKATFENSKDTIRTQLIAQQEQLQVPAFLQDLHSKAKIDTDQHSPFASLASTPSAAAPAASAAAPAATAAK